MEPGDAPPAAIAAWEPVLPGQPAASSRVQDRVHILSGFPSSEAVQVDVGPAENAERERPPFRGHALFNRHDTQGLLSDSEKDQQEVARRRTQHLLDSQAVGEVWMIPMRGLGYALLLAMLTLTAAFDADPAIYPLASAPVTIYVVMATAALTRGFLARNRPWLRFSPALLGGCHAAAVTVTAQSRLMQAGHMRGAYSRAYLEAAILQVAGMVYNPASKLSWLVSSMILLVVMLATEGRYGLKDEDVAGDTLVLAAAIFPAAIGLGKRTCATTLREYLLSELKEFFLGRHLHMEQTAFRTTLLPVLELAGTNVRPAILEEKLGETHQLLAEISWFPYWLKAPLLEFIDILQPILVKKSTSNTDDLVQDLDMGEQPAEVQNFVLENLVPQNGTSHIDEVQSLSRGPSLRPPSKLQNLVVEPKRNTYEQNVEDLLAVLMGKKRSQEEEAKPACDPLFYVSQTPRSSMSMIYRELGSWEFNALSEAASSPRAFAVHGYTALSGTASDLGLDDTLLKGFLVGMEGRYNDLPYHNSTHALDVLNSMLYMLGLSSTWMKELLPVERLAAMVAAVGHDVGHDGRSNRFHTVTASNLAQLFNDQSCLEMMHCAITFTILRSDGSCFLKDLDPPEWAFVRSSMVQFILETDLSKHLAAVSSFNQTFNMKDVTDKSKIMADVAKRIQLIAFTLKACDVSASAKSFAVHAEWACRINAEFFNQGDTEQKMGFPCSPLCERDGTNISNGQKGFYNFIVNPLYESLNHFLMSKRVKLEVLAEIEKNLKFWSEFDASLFNYDDPCENVQMLVQEYNKMMATHTGKPNGKGQEQIGDKSCAKSVKEKTLQATSANFGNLRRLLSF